LNKEKQILFKTQLGLFLDFVGETPLEDLLKDIASLHLLPDQYLIKNNDETEVMEFKIVEHLKCREFALKLQTKEFEGLITFTTNGNARRLKLRYTEAMSDHVLDGNVCFLDGDGNYSLGDISEEMFESVYAQIYHWYSEYTFSDYPGSLLELKVWEMIDGMDSSLTMGELVKNVAVTVADSDDERDGLVYHVVVFFEQDSDYYREKPELKKLLLSSSDELRAVSPDCAEITYLFKGSSVHEYGVLPQEQGDLLEIEEAADYELLELLGKLYTSVNEEPVMESYALLKLFASENARYARSFVSKHLEKEISVSIVTGEGDCPTMRVECCNDMEEFDWRYALVLGSDGLLIERGPRTDRLVYDNNLYIAGITSKIQESNWKKFLDHTADTIDQVGDMMNERHSNLPYTGDEEE